MDRSTEPLQPEARRYDAMVAADFDELDKLLSDRLTRTHASARQDTKASFMACCGAEARANLDDVGITPATAEAVRSPAVPAN